MDQYIDFDRLVPAPTYTLRITVPALLPTVFFFFSLMTLSIVAGDLHGKLDDLFMIFHKAST